MTAAAAPDAAPNAAPSAAPTAPPGETLAVLQVVRHPHATGSHSIEGLFETVRDYLPPDVRVEVARPPRLSSGLRNRLVNLRWMRSARWPVTHITGDVTYLAATLPRRGSIVTIHDTGWAARSRLGRAAFDLIWLRVPVARAERVTVISPAVRDAVVEATGCAPERLDVIPNGVHPAFVPAPEAPPPGGRPVVLQVGTTGNKNLARVAAALDGVDCELHVIGALDAAQRAALARHRVRYRVSVDVTRAEVVRAYQEAAVLTFVSTFEGFGLPILEAQAVGCPVVTSALAPMRDVAGGGACLVDPLDVDAIRSAVRRVLDDGAYRSALRARGAANAAAYSAATVAARYAALYREVAAGIGRR